jgi:hypothetical protein
MRKSFFYLSIALMMCFTFVLDAEAADPAMSLPKGKWNKKVESLEPGTLIDVHLKVGVTGTGKFVGLEGNSIRIKNGNQERTFPKSSVSKISVTEKGLRKSGAHILNLDPEVGIQLKLQRESIYRFTEYILNQICR